MGTFSFALSDSRDVAYYLNPNLYNSAVGFDGNKAVIKQSDHYELVTGDGTGTADLYGNGLTYNGDSISGGTITGGSFDGDGQRFFTASDIVVSKGQFPAYNDIDAAAALVFGGSDNILASSSNNTVAGYTGNDTIQGGAGDDVILGNQGADIILSNQDNDEVYGGQDNDVVFAGKGNDKVTGNEGNDAVAGNEGNDTLHGGQGNDIVYGGQDQDLIYGDIGNDTLYGNQGADVFRFAQGDGADLIADFSKSDGDKIDLQGLTYNVTQNAQGNAVVNVFGGGTIELAGIKAAAVDGSYFA